jgi:exodeoxyribonuclease X
MTALILDTETTDVENCEVIELGYIHYPEDVEPAFLRRYRPEGAIKWGALATHHILREELNDCPPAADAPGDVPLVDYWIGHNIDFDWRALGKPPVKRIDTLALCRLYWPEVDSHSLTAMAYFLLGANAGTKGRVRAAHAALDDVLICRSILEVIRKVHKIETMEELYAASEDARIPRKWTFGKFKGQPIEAADRGYANWCRKQPDFDPFVLEALRRANL